MPPRLTTVQHFWVPEQSSVLVQEIEVVPAPQPLPPSASDAAQS
jgi:hypothetical protein